MNARQARLLTIDFRPLFSYFFVLMARLVRHTALGPYKIDPKALPQDKMISICGCGLSQTMPFCDGSHKGCRTEEEGKLYVYDPDRKTVQEVRADDQQSQRQQPDT
jgi:CDGSH-type Zn-finger protein